MDILEGNNQSAYLKIFFSFRVKTSSERATSVPSTTALLVSLSSILDPANWTVTPYNVNTSVKIVSV